MLFLMKHYQLESNEWLCLCVVCMNDLKFYTIIYTAYVFVLTNTLIIVYTQLSGAARPDVR